MVVHPERIVHNEDGKTYSVDQNFDTDEHLKAYKVAYLRMLEIQVKQAAFMKARDFKETNADGQRFLMTLSHERLDRLMADLQAMLTTLNLSFVEFEEWIQVAR